MVKKFIRVALGVVIFTDCSGMDKGLTFSGDVKYGTKNMSLSPHFNKKEKASIQQNNTTNGQFNKNAVIPILLINDCEVFEYYHPGHMPRYQHDCVVEILDGGQPNLIQKYGNQKFTYEDLLEILLFLDGQKHCPDLFCKSIVQEYSEPFECAISFRKGGIRYCLNGVPVAFMLDCARLGKLELLESFINAEISLNVTPQEVGDYYKRALVALCNDFIKYKGNSFTGNSLESMLKVLKKLEIDSNFVIPGSCSTVLQWCSNISDPEAYSAIHRLFDRYRLKI